MRGNYSNIDKIRAELAWVNEPVDPNVCGCRHLLCCEQTGHALSHMSAQAYGEKLTGSSVTEQRCSGRSEAVGFQYKPKPSR